MEAAENFNQPFQYLYDSKGNQSHIVVPIHLPANFFYVIILTMPLNPLSVEEYSIVQDRALINEAAKKSWQVLEEIASFIKPGIKESEAHQQARQVYKNHSITRSWHNPYIKDSLKNEVLKRNPLNKNLKDSLPEPRSLLGSGLKNRRSRIFSGSLSLVEIPA